MSDARNAAGDAWGAADFDAIAAHLAPMHDDLVARLAPTVGLEWLDLACGTGPVAIRAARAGARVTASDFASALVARAQAHAVRAGLDIAFGVVDCQRTPYPTGAFDVVSSSVGVFLAPDHVAVASELARLVRPGGRIGLTAWRGAGVGEMLALLGEYAENPFGGGDFLAWGRDDHVRTLLEDTFELSFADGDAPLVGASGADLWDERVEHSGPTKVVVQQLSEGRRAELRERTIELFERDRVGDHIHQSRPYVTIVGTRRG
ncbi:MAG: class I SAM-dependent methyltransferase [Actinobacteria bacterium]|nr:class I SAM-dependent methyltransferase [Actinomycetota bacterium]